MTWRSFCARASSEGPAAVGGYPNAEESHGMGRHLAALYPYAWGCHVADELAKGRQSSSSARLSVIRFSEAARRQSRSSRVDRSGVSFPNSG